MAHRDAESATITTAAPPPPGAGDESENAAKRSSSVMSRNDDVGLPSSDTSAVSVAHREATITRAHDSPTTSPFSSMSIRSAAG